MIRFIVKASRIGRIGIIKPRWMQEERLLLKTLPIHLASYHPLNSQCQSNWTSQGLGYANGPRPHRGMVGSRRFSGIWGEEVVSAFLSAGATEIVAWQPWEHPPKQNRSKQFSQTFISSFQTCTRILLNVFQTIDSIELVSLLEFVGHSPVDLLVFVPGNLWLLPIVGHAQRGSLARCFHRQGQKNQVKSGNLQGHQTTKTLRILPTFLDCSEYTHVSCCIVIWIETNYPSYLFHRHHGQFFSHSVEVPSSEVLPWAARWTFVDPWQVGPGFYRREWKEHRMDDDSVIYSIWSNLYFCSYM